MLAQHAAYDGDLVVTDTYPITAAILTGFLAPLVETVNAVSAPHLLKEYGIEFSETRSAGHPDYAFQIRVKAVTDKESHEIAGTLFNGKEPRICGIDGTRVDVELVSGMVVCTNEDKPMVLGRIALTLGEAGVNIANLALGRKTAGGHATTVINIDGKMERSVLETLRKMPHVVEARFVQV